MTLDGREEAEGLALTLSNPAEKKFRHGQGIKRRKRPRIKRMKEDDEKRRRSFAPTLSNPAVNNSAMNGGKKKAPKAP